MQKRRLGRTGLEATVIGFGGVPTMHSSRGEAIKVMRRAYDLGINYFDTARLYKDGEEKLGEALEGVRDDCIIATKTNLWKKGETEAYIRQSLRNLRTDRIDMYQLHGVMDEETLEKMMGPEGALAALREARARGKVDFIGITGHRPHILVKAIKTGEFDTVQVPLNAITRQATEELLPLAREMGVGVLVMKPFGGTSKDFPGSAEYKELLGDDPETIARRTLRFILAQDVCTVLPGLSTVEEVDIAVRVGEEFEGLTREEEEWYDRLKPSDPFCRNCGTLYTCGICLPCPEVINIPAILRFDSYYVFYGRGEWARRQYQRLSTKAGFCTKCGDCEGRCPYNLPIIEMLRRADERLREA